ncbi:MAG: hypothetical protein HZA66_04045 [Rhodopseudomonas palustris]|uniref:Uncharacterized protein n=1 Tax=Rhodopseudomonas palustris TaxID=1076 RepID=A0A933RUS1_RHOPL|nr:hypothetical protein [Rhodopseudomonas palustris]
MKKQIRWMTYNQRVSADIESAFRSPDAQEFFCKEFVDSLAVPIKQQEEWIIKLLTIQFTLVVFLLVGFVSEDVTFHVLGVDLKNIVGLREVLLALSVTAAMFAMLLLSARDTAIHMITEIQKRKSPEAFRHFAAFAAPRAFNFRVYLPREFDDWIFERIPRGVYAFIFFPLLASVFGSLIAVSFVVQWIIITEVWKAPMLGAWSYAAIGYAIAVYLLNCVILLRRSLPFPYYDSSELKRLGARALDMPRFK